MKAWTVDPATKQLDVRERPVPAPRRGAVTVRIEAAMVLSYMKEVLSGARGHGFPARPFTPGTNGIGTIEAVGEGVYHLEPGQRVSLHPHLVADERVAEPAQLLLGHLARFGEASDRLQSDWIDGTFAEFAEWPADIVTPIGALGAMPAAEALGLSKTVVPYGGLLRIALAPGEVVAINGASGFYGSGGVLVALAMGASKVLAVGRDAATLRRVAEAAGERVVPVALAGDTAADTRALRAAAGGPIDAALDMIDASSAAATTSVLRSLRRGGRLAMMGSCSEPLSIGYGEMLANDWLIAGQFMYPKDAPARLVRLAASGQLRLGAVKPRTYPLADLPRAMDEAATMRGLDITALVNAPR